MGWSSCVEITICQGVLFGAVCGVIIALCLHIVGLLSLHFHTALSAQPGTAGEQGNGQITHNYLVMLVRD